MTAEVQHRLKQESKADLKQPLNRLHIVLVGHDDNNVVTFFNLGTIVGDHDILTTHQRPDHSPWRQRQLV